MACFSAWDIQNCGCGGGGGPCLDGQICLTVTNCCSPFGAISGASIVVTKHSNGAAIGSCTTNGSGQCCVTVPGNDDYDIAISKGGSSPSVVSNLHVACATTVNQTACTYIPSAINACFAFTVLGCAGGGGLQGANVTITGPKGGGGATDSSGIYIFCTDTLGTYSYTITKTRFVAATGSFTISGTPCGGGSSSGTTVSLIPDTGYVCCPGSGCADPQATTLTVTGPGGSVTANYCAFWGGWVGLGSIFSSSVASNCFGGVGSGSITFFVDVVCNSSNILIHVGVSAAQFAQTSFDPGTWAASSCSWTYTKHCVNAIGCGSGPITASVTNCAPFAGSGVATCPGVGSALSGTWSFSE